MPDISSSLSKREVNARQNTYTKSEIDLKDGAIQAIAEAAQTTADAAEKKNQEHDQLIAELQEKTDGLQETPTTLWLNNFIDVQMPSCGGRAIAAATIRASRSMTASEPSTRQWAVLRIIDRDTGRLFWKADLDFSFGNGRTIGLTNVADVRKLGNRFALYAAHRYSYDAFCTVDVVVCDATEKGVSSPRLFFSLEYVMPYGEISLNTLDSSSLSSGNWLLLRCEDLSHKHNNMAILNQISAAFTTEDKEKLDDLENRYTKPAAGIPKSDLASGVQASLGKADTALQKHQDISGKVDNTAAGADSLLSKITNNWTATPTDDTYFIRQDTSSKNEFGRVKFSTLWSYIKSKVESLGYTKNTGTITGIKMNGASKGTSGVVDLGTVITAHQDISGKQDKSTAVTHSANTAVGSATKPVYVAANGVATPISHSINSDVPANAKFTDTTYNDATQSAHGLMTAADKKKLDSLSHAESISSLVFKNHSSKTYMGVKFSANRVSARFLVMENNGRRADIYVSIRIGIDTKATVYASWNTDTEFRIFYDNEGYIYVIFNCSAWSNGSCISTIKNDTMTQWNGTSYPSNLTAITTDIRYTLDSANFTSYALAKDGTAKKAETLTDSGWIATTRDTTFTVTSTVKCRKYEQLVEVRGEVTFNSTYGSPTVCTLPAGYRPATVVQACGITPSGKQYMIKADTSGVISFGSDSGSTFVNGTTYRVDLTYLLG